MRSPRIRAPEAATTAVGVPTPMGATLVDAVVVGAGIVGLATAYQLLVSGAGRRIVVLEKEPQVALHQSSRNSGVLHAGVYYRPGSLKARLCQRGKQLLEAFAAEHGITVVRNGKVVVAVEPSELGRFRALADRARTNSVPGLRELDSEELYELEPHVAGLRALHSPGTAVVDFAAVCHALAQEVKERGGEVRTSAAVTQVEEAGGRVRISSAAGHYECRAAVVCAGLQADRLAGRQGPVRIIPFRGSWYGVGGPSAGLVRGNVYPVPDPRFPFLGVHFTKRVDGSVWVGPNAVLAGGREAYARGSVNVRDLLGLAAFPGTWRLGRRHLTTAAGELWRDRVRHAYVREVRRYVPAVRAEDLIPGPTGIRAQAARADGSLVDDFVVRNGGRVVHLLNAPSPGATSALALGQLLAGEAAARL